MANSFIKAETVVAQALGVLERDTVLAQFVWRDAIPAEKFRGTKNDTVTLRVPAYMDARVRTMRSATAIIIDDFDETSVDVKLDTHVYKAIRATDEEMTLDVTNFGEQIQGPVMSSVVRKIDDGLGLLLAGADTEVTVALDEDDPYLGIVDARTALNLASVPPGQRWLAVGANVEAAILKSDRLSKFDTSGSSEPMREAIIGRIGGFTAVSAIGLNPDTAVAAHRTAFVLVTVPPMVPNGAAWGATQSYRGFSLRVLWDYLPDDAAGPADRYLCDTFAGFATVADNGTIDDEGRFIPDADEDPIVVRAVKLTLGTSS